MDQAIDKTSEDLAKGCIVGALCGDAIGAYLEFNIDVTEEQVKEALKLPGGGPFELARGQITDDGELTLCLGQGLADSEGILNLNKIAEYYGKWYQSSPFDCGRTIGNAVQNALGARGDYAKRMRSAARNLSDSESNGALMRLTPLCVWCANLRKDHLINCVTEETKLTHSNKNAIDVNIAYAYTIQHLLNNKGDNTGAYEKCKDILKELENEEVLGWVGQMEKEGPPKAQVNIGHVKIAFCYALYYLNKKSDYLEAMGDMLSKGGDTDTNCCIIGGMLGALHGYEKLPSDIVKTVMSFDPEKDQSGQYRPEFLVPCKTVNNFLKEILEKRPRFAYISAKEADDFRVAEK